ncbi:MAG: hypothetical protein C0478_14280 [Planctomyces sp.]|nr:hypothetical protein [Planctomyces sp.]
MNLWRITTLGMTILTVTLLASSLAGDAPSGLKVVVLKTRKVLEGEIRPVTGGYTVERGSNSIMLPDEQVECAASSLAEAYQQIRTKRRLPGGRNPTVEDHQQLAEWCISYGLFQEARDEIRMALKLDPERTASRRLLMRVEEMLDPSRPVIVAPKTDSLGYQPQMVESLGGLSQATATEFSLKVHPILMNKCGLGSCHGSSTKSDFRLNTTRVGGGSHRLYAERNLATIAAHINLDDPASSPLLVSMREAHGGMTQTPFGGSAGRQQLQLLERWVYAYALDRNPKLAQQQQIAQTGFGTPAKPPGRLPGGTDASTEFSGQMQVPSGEIEPTGTMSSRNTVISVSGVGAPGLAAGFAATGIPGALPLDPNSGNPSSGGLLSGGEGMAPELLPEEVTGRMVRGARADAFDPDLFNRRHHGREFIDRDRAGKPPTPSALPVARPVPPAANTEPASPVSSSSKGQP